MTKRVFISFKAEDKKKVDGLRLLAKNPNYKNWGQSQVPE
jgi:hypothetical protein